MAVPPRFTTRRRSSHLASRQRSRLERLRVRAHLAAERRQHRVLILGAADLDDVREGALLRLERLLQRDARPRSRSRSPQMAAMRSAVGNVSFVLWCRLTWSVGDTTSYVAARPAEQLERAVGQHLVHVHVGAGAGAALQRVDDDVGRERAVEQFVAGALEGVGRVGVQVAERPVRAHGRQLDRAERAGEVRDARRGRAAGSSRGPARCGCRGGLVRGQVAPPEGVVFAPDGHRVIVSRRAEAGTRRESA